MLLPLHLNLTGKAYRSAGGGRRSYRIISADDRPIHFEPKYDEKELVRLIRKAAEEDSRKAEIQLEAEAKRLDEEIRTLKEVELAILRFKHAFDRANEQVQRKYRENLSRLLEVKKNMEQEEELIMKLLLEAL